MPPTQPTMTGAIHRGPNHAAPARSTIDGDRNRYGAERPWTAEPIAAVSRIRRAADDDANDEEALAATCDNGIELIKDRVNQLDWEDMERLVAGMLKAMGYYARVIPKDPDDGRDVVASPDAPELESPQIVAEVNTPQGRHGRARGEDFHWWTPCGRPRALRLNRRLHQGGPLRSRPSQCPRAPARFGCLRTPLRRCLRQGRRRHPFHSPAHPHLVASVKKGVLNPASCFRYPQGNSSGARLRRARPIQRCRPRRREPYTKAPHSPRFVKCGNVFPRVHCISLPNRPRQPTRLRNRSRTRHVFSTIRCPERTRPIHLCNRAPRRTLRVIRPNAPTKTPAEPLCC